jgi:hypothetical protein
MQRNTFTATRKHSFFAEQDWFFRYRVGVPFIDVVSREESLRIGILSLVVEAGDPFEENTHRTSICRLTCIFRL